MTKTIARPWGVFLQPGTNVRCLSQCHRRSICFPGPSWDHLICVTYLVWSLYLIIYFEGHERDKWLKWQCWCRKVKQKGSEKVRKSKWTIFTFLKILTCQLFIHTTGNSRVDCTTSCFWNIVFSDYLCEYRMTIHGTH